MSSSIFATVFVIFCLLADQSLVSPNTPAPDKGKEYLREICKIFKPKSSFDGIQAYHQIQRADKMKPMSHPVGHYHMYRSGKEWEFTVHISYQNISLPRIDLLDQTLRDIRDDGLQVLHQFSVFFDYDDVNSRKKRELKVDLPNGVHDCDVIRNGTAISVECCCNMKGEKISRNQSKDFDSKSLITFSPTPGKLNQWVGLLDKSNKGNVKFYGPYTNSFRTADQCPKDCIIPPFIKEMDDHLFKKLDAVVEYGWDMLKPQGWLLFFNKDSKSKFCFTEKDKLSEGCKPQNLQEYGMECTGRKLVVSGRALDVMSFADPPEESGGTSWFLVVFLAVLCICVVGAVFAGGVYGGMYYGMPFRPWLVLNLDSHSCYSQKRIKKESPVVRARLLEHQIRAPTLQTRAGITLVLCQ